MKTYIKSWEILLDPIYTFTYWIDKDWYFHEKSIEIIENMKKDKFNRYAFLISEYKVNKNNDNIKYKYQKWIKNSDPYFIIKDIIDNKEKQKAIYRINQYINYIDWKQKFIKRL